MRTKESGEFIAREYLYYVSFHVVCFLCCTAPFYRELLLFCTVSMFIVDDLLRAKFLMSCDIPLNSWMFLFYNFFMDERQLNENYDNGATKNSKQTTNIVRVIHRTRKFSSLTCVLTEQHNMELIYGKVIGRKENICTSITTKGRQLMRRWKKMLRSKRQDIRLERAIGAHTRWAESRPYSPYINLQVSSVVRTSEGYRVELVFSEPEERKKHQRMNGYVSLFLGRIF